MIDLSPTYLQYITFLKLFLWGMLPALVVSILNFFRLIFKNNYVINLIFDLFISLSLSALFLLLVNIYAFGEIRIFLLIAYLLGFILFYFTLGKLIAKLNKIVYTTLCKLHLRFTNTKIGKVLSK